MTTSAEGNTDAGTRGTTPVSEQVFAQTSAVSDQATNIDSLGFKLYVEALADFLLAPSTRAPFTVSIEGTWGTGKSSFMLQLKERIKAESDGAINIDFNAWKYDKQEELWAAFALTVSRSLRRNTRLLRRFIGDLKLYRSRLKGPGEIVKLIAKLAIWLGLMAAFAGGVNWSYRASFSERQAVAQKAIDDALPSKPSSSANAPVMATPKSNEIEISPNTRSSASPNTGQSAGSDAKTSLPKEGLLFAIANSPWATGVILLIWLVMKFPGLSGKTIFELELEKYIDRPDYKGKAAFIDAFSEDFGKTMRAYAPTNGAKVFVFIDDLDRCEVPKAADLMQAINLMIGDESPLFFVIGLDRAKVAASIAFKYRGIGPYLLSQSELAAGASMRKKPDYAKIRAFGDEFLEKFIQISFPIPVSDDDEQAREFINSLVSPSEGRVLSSNWLRRFARFLMSKSQSPTTSVKPPALKESTRDPFRIERGPESERIRSVLLMVREILGHNPRRIKAFLNRFRLMLYIASSQGLLDKDPKTGIAEVTLEQLGKFIALMSAYPDVLPESMANDSFFHDLEKYLIWGKAKGAGQLASEVYVEQWLRRPGVRSLIAPPKTLTATWKNTSSLERFPVSKFVRVLPPVPVPPKRLAKIQVQFASTEGVTPAEASAPLATGINFERTADPLPERLRVESENIPSSFFVSQVPDLVSEVVPTSGRTVSAQVRFGEPELFPEEEQIDEKDKKGAGKLGSPRGEDDPAAPHIDGVGSASTGSRVTGGAIRQIL